MDSDIIILSWARCDTSFELTPESLEFDSPRVHDFKSYPQVYLDYFFLCATLMIGVNSELIGSYRDSEKFVNLFDGFFVF